MHSAAQVANNPSTCALLRILCITQPSAPSSTDNSSPICTAASLNSHAAHTCTSKTYSTPLHTQALIVLPSMRPNTSGGNTWEDPGSAADHSLQTGRFPLPSRLCAHLHSAHAWRCPRAHACTPHTPTQAAHAHGTQRTRDAGSAASMTWLLLLSWRMMVMVVARGTPVDHRLCSSLKRSGGCRLTDGSVQSAPTASSSSSLSASYSRPGSSPASTCTGGGGGEQCQRLPHAMSVTSPRLHAKQSQRAHA